MRASLVLFLVVLWHPDAYTAKWPRCLNILQSWVKPTPAPVAMRQNDAAIPFPDLAAAMGRTLGISRPARAPLDPLAPHPDPDTLPKEVLLPILAKMSAYSNWATVSYGSSSGTPQGRVQAEWFKQDARDDIQEYLAELSDVQRKITIAAYKGDMAEVPDFNFPEVITLDWILQNYPERERPRLFQFF